LFFTLDFREGIPSDGSRMTMPFASCSRESEKLRVAGKSQADNPKYLNHSLEVLETLYGSPSQLPANCLLPGYALAVLPSETIHVVHSVLSRSVFPLADPANLRLGEFRYLAKRGRSDYR